MRIFVVEDDPKIVDLLEKALSAVGYAVTSEGNGTQALGILQKTAFDLIVLDLMIPGIDGLALLERIRSLKIDVPIVILSAKHSLEDRLAGLHRGSDDYLVKPFAMAELLAKIQILLRRSTHSSAKKSSELYFADLTMNLDTHEVFRSGKKIVLHVKEFLLLEYLLRNPEKVLTKALILENIWGYDFDPQTNVVDVLICRLRNKVDKDFDEKLIQTQRGVGYVLRQH